MPTFEDVKITEDVMAKPFVHAPADELHVKIFHNEENPRPNPLVLSWAKVVSFTANTITVRSLSGVDAVFVDGGMVRVDGSKIVDNYVDDMRYRIIEHSSSWITVSNYRANEDGTQTWDYQIQTGELVECTEMFAHYYGQSDNSYYEVTGPSGWRL
jgi:hypothetical protein